VDRFQFFPFTQMPPTPVVTIDSDYSVGNNSVGDNSNGDNSVEDEGARLLNATHLETVCDLSEMLGDGPRDDTSTDGPDEVDQDQGPIL
jgi:hypothetical protein